MKRSKIAKIVLLKISNSIGNLPVLRKTLIHPRSSKTVLYILYKNEIRAIIYKVLTIIHKNNKKVKHIYKLKP